MCLMQMKLANYILYYAISFYGIASTFTDKKSYVYPNNTQDNSKTFKKNNFRQTF